MSKPRFVATLVERHSPMEATFRLSVPWETTRFIDQQVVSLDQVTLVCSGPDPVSDMFSVHVHQFPGEHNYSLASFATGNFQYVLDCMGYEMRLS